MIKKRPLGLKIFGISLLIWSFICIYVNSLNIIAVGRPFIQYFKYIFISTDLLIIVQSMLYLIINILFFINAIRILKLKSYAIKELFILIVLNEIVYFSTNFLIMHNLSLAFKYSKFTLLIWIIVVYYFTRPRIKTYFA